MPLDSQRIIQMMILKAQHTPKLVAGTVPMDFNLFVNVGNGPTNVYEVWLILYFLSIIDYEKYLFIDNDYGGSRYTNLICIFIFRRVLTR